MEPLYDDYPSFTPDWYPEMYSSPFHRPSRCPSPFDTRRPSPFDSMFTEPRKPARAERGRSPQNMNVEEPVDMKSQDCSGKRKSNSDSDFSENTKIVDSKPAKKEEVNDQAEPSTALNSEESPSKATTGEESKPIPEIQKINKIVEKTVELENNILSFEGARKSKQYIFIEESLVSLLLLLDNIETNGNMDIRKARKSAVCHIQQLLADLEEKVETDKNITNEVKSDKVEEYPEDKAEDVANLEGSVPVNTGAMTPVEMLSEEDESNNSVKNDLNSDKAEQDVSEDMLTDVEVTAPAEDTSSEGEGDEMESEINLDCTPAEPENKASSDNDGETPPITDSEVPIAEMDTSNLLTVNTTAEVLLQPDEEALIQDVNMEGKSMDTVTVPIVMSPSDDEGSSEETVTE